MINITNKTECCGCNACGDICSHKAISFKTDIEGFWYPEVNKDLCTDCGLCEKVCPIINIQALKQNDLPQSLTYAAINNSMEVRFDSTSGGLFSALADYMYEQGGYVGGAIWNEEWGVQHFISSNHDDLRKLRSSKYLQSDLQGFYKAVRDLLIHGEKVLVCGTPCQMAALRAFLKKPYENLIIIDFICRGINSPKVFKKFIEYLENKHNSKVVYFKSKNKELGWRRLTNKVVFENGDVEYDPRETSPYLLAYLKTNALCRPSCYDCKFKGMPRIADITVADFWGGEVVVSEGMDGDLGTSLVLVNSSKGEIYFEKIKDKIRSEAVPFESIFKGNVALKTSLPQPQLDRNQFYRDVDAQDFKDVIDKYISRPSPLSFRQKVKNFLVFFRIIFSISGCSPHTLYQNLKYNIFDSRVNASILHHRYMLIMKHCIIDLDKKAKIELGDVFELGVKKFKKSKLETRLLIGPNGILKTRGFYSVGYGADIEIFKDACLEIDGGGYTNIEATIICGEHIHIQKNVILGRNVSIRDHNGEHYLAVDGYKTSVPVTIGQHVWLCADCRILPGVTIGDGSVIAANAVVTKDVPSFTLAAGCPAKNIKNIIWK